MEVWFPIIGYQPKIDWSGYYGRAFLPKTEYWLLGSYPAISGCKNFTIAHGMIEGKKINYVKRTYVKNRHGCQE